MTQQTKDQALRESVAYVLRAYQQRLEEQDDVIRALRAVLKRVMRFGFSLSAVVAAGFFCFVMSLLTR